MDVFLSENSVAIKTNERQLKKNPYVEEDKALFAIRSSSISVLMKVLSLCQVSKSTFLPSRLCGAALSSITCIRLISKGKL